MINRSEKFIYNKQFMGRAECLSGNKRYANMTNQPVHPAELDYY